ncbi:MAG TPA: aspartate carbamoyltransferase catalytic subunit [Peptococcaceae bacterium]|jgi:aspartate carbamoyltransferase catalytic subunit|nr:aspartate carbamoyltransferase catalytic subunit [Clostridia bacterium]HOB82437.1 aspartate carbamoyltransferase catalytic subunit [Peptococcaceae bacterium]HQD53509.1 aspartate carbamoyltransferase catalytic subunit [Peptococcaceae bacterium]
MRIKAKDLIGMDQLDREQIGLILQTAKEMKTILKRDIKKVPTLRGKSVVTLFFEPSTRTRTSFELAAKYMSADLVNINTSVSSVVKGESLKDTGKTLEAMGVDIVVIRHSMAGAPQVLGGYLKARVINAGDGFHQHPTQALLDMMTIQERLGGFEGLKVAIVGDILHSRVARSNLFGLTTMGAEVTFCGPPTLMPPGLERPGVNVTYDMDEAVAEADVVMMLRIQLERQKAGYFPSIREYSRCYGLNKQRLALAKKDCLVLHPGPINRGVEMAGEVADSLQSCINEQVTNGVAVRMALLYLMLEQKEE